MIKKKKGNDEKDEIARRCKIEGCEENAQFPAPSRKQLPSLNFLDEGPLDKDWYCQAHIREFNEGWNFFAGMSEEEILQFQKDSVIGHRITAPSNLRVSSISKKLEMAAKRIRSGENMPEKNEENYLGLAPEKMKKHILVLELNYPFSMEDLKKNYRDMVKKYHPDQGGENADIEKFAKVKDSYEILREYLESQEF